MNATGMSYRAAMDLATSSYPVGVRREAWHPEIYVTADEDGMRRHTFYGAIEPWGPTSDDMAAWDWETANEEINMKRNETRPMQERTYYLADIETGEYVARRLESEIKPELIAGLEIGQGRPVYPGFEIVRAS